MTPVVDVYELCGLAGQTVTSAYRCRHPRAVEVDEAHGRIASRYPRLRGRVAADDVDVRVVVTVAADLDRRERTEARRDRRVDQGVVIREIEEASGVSPDGDTLPEAVARIGGRPMIGALHREVVVT